MGIPKFYKWLKNKYPLIRYDLTDKQREKPIFDNFYIDFNALIYRCIRQNNCFLRNKIKPLTITEIHERVLQYLLNMLSIIQPTTLLFIAIDGVAPRAKINQSRYLLNQLFHSDRRFKSGITSIEFDNLLQKIGLNDLQFFEQNSISPGTEFLTELCVQLKKDIMNLMETDLKYLKVMFSDCLCPGQGEHKIMDFIRYSQSNQLFNKNTTHCIYSPDADMILLALSLEIDNVVVFKENTNVSSENWLAAVANVRLLQPVRFELVMINILKQYFCKQFEQELKINHSLQSIIDDLILLISFVGNDFLPVQFCFTLNDGHMSNLFDSYKKYLSQSKTHINQRGIIDWQNISMLLEIACTFQANMLGEKIRNKKNNRFISKKTTFEDKNSTKQQTKNIKTSKKKPDKIEMIKDDEDLNKKVKQSLIAQQETDQWQDEQQYQEQLEVFQVKNNKIVKGRQEYYRTRFNINDINTSCEFIKIMQKYTEGLEFYCLYYFKQLPSWSWYYPYHYTPLLCDVHQYVLKSKINIKLYKGIPYDPFMALMMMLPLRSFNLLPPIFKQQLNNAQCVLRTPIDYYPKKFKIDKYETIKYNKRALLQFLNEQQVKKVYITVVEKKLFSSEEKIRNQKHNMILFNYILNGNKSKLTGTECVCNNATTKQLQNTFSQQKQFDSLNRLPSLSLYGNYGINHNCRIVVNNRYKYQGNPSQLVYFNGFIGFIDEKQICNQQLKKIIEKKYESNGISGKCEYYYKIKRARYIREIGRFNMVKTRKEVFVPDFAVLKVPKYEYIHRVQQVTTQINHHIGQKVIILTPKYFGQLAIIEKIDKDILTVRSDECSYQVGQKIIEDQQIFYTVEYVLNLFDITYNTLLAILDQINIRTNFHKNKNMDYFPNSLNFSLNVISVRDGLLMPQYVRCQMQFQNTKKPDEIFKKMQISQSCIILIKHYTRQFSWLIEYLQDNIDNKNYSLSIHDLFPKQSNSNIRLLKEFIKLYKFSHDGIMYSIYSKIAHKQQKIQLKLQPKNNQCINLQFYQVISKKQAKKCGPAYKMEPEYHAIGDRVIHLASLQIAFIVGIDDYMFHVLLGKKMKPLKAAFWELYNEKWYGQLSSEIGVGWNMEPSYYTPNYWNKAQS